MCEERKSSLYRIQANLGEGWRDRIDRNLERMHLFVTIVVSHPSVIHLFGMMISAACNADQKGGPRMGGKRRVS